MPTDYVLAWEFQVRPGMECEFEAHYGPAGTWARLFGGSADHVETMLLADGAAPGRYLTIDRWRSEQGYRAFRSAFATQYDRLDRACERLTLGERSLGAFHAVRGDGAARTLR